MRHLLAAFAALAASLAFVSVAPAQTISKSQTGAVGTVVTCTDTSGQSVKCVLPATTPVSAAGVEKGTTASPMVVVGPQTAGSAATGGGLRVMGKDSSNNARDITTDGSGNLVALSTGLTPGGSPVTYLASRLDGTSAPTAASTYGPVVSGFDGTNSKPLKLSTGTGGGNLLVEEGGRTFSNITAAATSTVKSGAGVLHTLTVNLCVASATITLYDNTAASGARIATVTCPGTVGNPFSLHYGLAFATGLTIVTSGATDITTTYR